MRTRFDIAATTACAVLLAVAIWRIQAVHDKLDEARTDQPSGQTVTADGITTERFLGEPLGEWARRHREALKQFEKGR